MFDIEPICLQGMCAHGAAMKALNFRGLVSLNWDFETIRSDEIEHECTKSIDGSTRANLGRTTGSASGHRAVELILLVSNKASGSSVNMQIRIDDGSGIRRARVNLSNNFIRKGSIRWEDE
jgi:hypothetical protein